MKIFINESHTQFIAIAETDEDCELLRDLKNGELCAELQITGEVQVVKAAMFVNNIKVIEETPLHQT